MLGSESGEFGGEFAYDKVLRSLGGLHLEGNFVMSARDTWSAT